MADRNTSTDLSKAITKKLRLGRPPMPTDPALYQSPAADLKEGQLRTVFLGVATVLITDGKSSILTDGFFSRPGVAQVMTSKIGPNESVIRSSLERAGIDKLEAVVVAHSHYDHAMDAPMVCQLTGAELLGSHSTLNIGLGSGLRRDQMKLLMPGTPVTYGPFTVTGIRSIHSPGGRWEGKITNPVHPPARVKEFKMAECFSTHIEHRAEDGTVRRLLVHASANFLPGMLDGYQADVAYLAMTLLGRQSSGFRTDYWANTVETVGARRVIPIHWDDFFRPLDASLVPIPYIGDDFPAGLADLRRRGKLGSVRVEMPRPFVVTDPFEAIS